MSGTDVQIRDLEARTDQLAGQVAQPTLNHQKEHGHPRRQTQVSVRQRRRMGPTPTTGAEAQVPPAESNDPPAPHNVPFRCAPLPGETPRLLMLVPRRFLLKQ